MSQDDAIPQLEQTLRTAKTDAELVARAKANTDADFNGHPSTMSTFIDAVLQGFQKKNEMFTDAILRDQNFRTPKHLRTCYEEDGDTTPSSPDAALRPGG